MQSVECVRVNHWYMKTIQDGSQMQNMKSISGFFSVPEIDTSRNYPSVHTQTLVYPSIHVYNVTEDGKEGDM